MAWYDWLTAPFRTEFFMETTFVARVYGQSLRDNFLDGLPAPGKEEAFNQLKVEFENETASGHPNFSQLLRIEAGLAETLRDEDIRSRYWTIEDRFRRVVPLATQASYRASVPAVGAEDWNKAGFIRSQVRTLLGSIHSNYVLNMAREMSVKRLKILLFLIFGAVNLVCYLLFTHYTFSDFNLLKIGIVLMVYLGVLGALLSICQRLQAAVSQDAMTDDGIFELTGLRLGWVGLALSLFMGGAFAVVLYAIVMSDLLKSAQVDVVTTKPPPVVATSSPAAGDSASAASVTPDTASPPPARLAQVNVAAATQVPVCQVRDKSACVTVENLAAAMKFADVPSFYKMLILAFLAGFAERLVPDILGRLSKRGT